MNSKNLTPSGSTEAFIKTIRLSGFLSYAPQSKAISLKKLNVMIGPNGSGKSNFLEAISLLKSTPTDLAGALRSGGGVREYLWRGTDSTDQAELEAVLTRPKDSMALRYRLRFTAVNQRVELLDEVVENERPLADYQRPFFYYRFQDGRPAISVRNLDNANDRTARNLERQDINPEQSVLAQRKDPDLYPELTFVANNFGDMRLYREWTFGRASVLREAQAPDQPSDFLLENCRNLGLVLSDIQVRSSDAWRLIISNLKELYPAAQDISIGIGAGLVQVFVRESFVAEPIPATRVSDGTLRFLCLLAVLCHPNPPPLICIDEPELGLHPDLLPTLAKLLVTASDRTQLIVSTHSDKLLSALLGYEDSVLVCEKRGLDGTQMRRLDSDKLKLWLDEYSLGDLWVKGELGGVRW